MVIKKLSLTVIFLVFLTAIGSCQNSKNSRNSEIKNNRFNDSVFIFKTDTVKHYSLYSIDTKTGKWKPKISKKINYHKIDIRDKSLTFFFQTKEQNDWSKRKLYYDSISVEKTGTSFYYNSGYFESTFLDTLNSKTIAHTLNADEYIRFTNLKQIKMSELKKLKVRQNNVNSEKEQREYSITKTRTDDFEYSDYWRKEAFKKTVQFIKQVLGENTPSCLIVSRSSYNSNRVEYIGQKGYKLKLYVEFDCNQDYINPSYFWVYAFYIGDNKWELKLIDYKLTH